MTEAQRLAEWLDANSSSEEFQRVAERVAYLRRLEAECEHCGHEFTLERVEY